MIILILKILAMWTLASIALALVVGPALKRLRQEQSEELANRLYPLPSGSMDVNHPKKVS